MKRQKRISAPAAIIPVVLLLCIAGWFLYPRPSIQFTQEKPVLEKGVTYISSDFVSDSDGQAVPEKETLNTEEVGEYQCVYTVEKWFVRKDFVLDYEVVDTTPPVITFRKEKILKEEREEFSLDEMKENVSVNEGTFQIETNYDPEISGSYYVNVTAEDDYGNKSIASYEVVVKDVDAPLIFVTGNGAKIVKGEEFDINEIISYGDNADPTPTLKTTGEVDTDNPGYYPIHAMVTDASGNSTEWDLTVEVVNEKPKDNPSSYYTPFEAFKENYSSEGRKFGIDVSSWQEDIDFKAVKEAGCEFVMIRVGYSYDGDLKTDRKFVQNIRGAKEAGLPVGIYLFCYDNTKEELLSSLEMVFEQLDGEELDLPFAFDWENFGNYQDYKLSFQMLNQLYDIFEEEVNQRGYDSILYSSKYYLETIWTHTDTRPVWMAHYTSWSSYEKPYMIWQCSASGRIDGIQGNVDLDILFEE